VILRDRGASPKGGQGTKPVDRGETLHGVGRFAPPLPKPAA
jgi:hypothetical protein